LVVSEEELMLTMDKRLAGTGVVTHTTIPSRVGELTVAARGDTVVGLYFPGHWHRPDPASFGPCRDIGFDAVRDQIGQYLAGDRQQLTMPVAANGDEYHERVWSLVRQIPYGETATYGDLARHLGDGTTPQEVGAAVGRNPVCLLVPCHRVVGAGGKLAGYAGGLTRKRFLLGLEAEVSGRASRLF
jgi:methylated-DNA-[protein]-cysteine S-methyltransferase